MQVLAAKGRVIISLLAVVVDASTCAEVEVGMSETDVESSQSGIVRTVSSSLRLGCSHGVSVSLLHSLPLPLHLRALPCSSPAHPDPLLSVPAGS